MHMNIAATGLVIFQGAKWEILTSMYIFHIYLKITQNNKLLTISNIEHAAI